MKLNRFYLLSLRPHLVQLLGRALIPDVPLKVTELGKIPELEHLRLLASDGRTKHVLGGTLGATDTAGCDLISNRNGEAPPNVLASANTQAGNTSGRRRTLEERRESEKWCSKGNKDDFCCWNRGNAAGKLRRVDTVRCRAHPTTVAYSVHQLNLVSVPKRDRGGVDEGRRILLQFTF